MFTSFGAVAPAASMFVSGAGCSASDTHPVQSTDSGGSPDAFEQQFDAALADTSTRPPKKRAQHQPSEEPSSSRDVEGDNDEHATEQDAAAVATTVASWQALRPLNVSAASATVDPPITDASSSAIASTDPETAQETEAGLVVVETSDASVGEPKSGDDVGPGLSRAGSAGEPQALGAAAESDADSAAGEQETRSKDFHENPDTADGSSSDQSSRVRRGGGARGHGEGLDQAATDRFAPENQEQPATVANTFVAPSKPGHEAAPTPPLSASPDQASTHQPGVVVPTNVAASGAALEGFVPVEPLSGTPDDTPDAGFPDRLVQSMRMQALRGGGEAIVQIRPEHLGPVTVSLRLENGTVSAQILAADPRVVSWLNAHQDVLREGLQSNGLTLDRLVVDQDGRGSDRRERRREAPPRPRYEHSADRHSTFELTI
jgi:flagellar hook-length control protein FliK